MVLHHLEMLDFSLSLIEFSFLPPRLELAAVEAEKARLTALVKSLEEQVESWVRVRDSLSKQLAENEAKYQEAQEANVSLMKVRENNIKLLEEHLNSVKVSDFAYAPATEAFPETRSQGALLLFQAINVTFPPDSRKRTRRSLTA